LGIAGGSAEQLLDLGHANVVLEVDVEGGKPNIKLLFSYGESQTLDRQLDAGAVVIRLEYVFEEDPQQVAGDVPALLLNYLLNGLGLGATTFFSGVSLFDWQLRLNRMEDDGAVHPPRERMLHHLGGLKSHEMLAGVVRKKNELEGRLRLLWPSFVVQFQRGEGRRIGCQLDAGLM
jgi:hypothetical protein